MILNDSSEIIRFDNTPISKAEQLGLGFPKKMRYYINNVVRINGKYYYAKKCSTSTLINELLGILHARHNGGVNVLWCDGHVTKEVTRVGKDEMSYTASYNAYKDTIFQKGEPKYVKDPDNKWDRY